MNVSLRAGAVLLLVLIAVVLGITISSSVASMPTYPACAESERVTQACLMLEEHYLEGASSVGSRFWFWISWLSVGLSIAALGGSFLPRSRA